MRRAAFIAQYAPNPAIAVGYRKGQRLKRFGRFRFRRHLTVPARTVRRLLPYDHPSGHRPSDEALGITDADRALSRSVRDVHGVYDADGLTDFVTSVAANHMNTRNAFAYARPPAPAATPGLMDWANVAGNLVLDAYERYVKPTVADAVEPYVTFAKGLYNAHQKVRRRRELFYGRHPLNTTNPALRRLRRANRDPRDL